MQLEQSRAKKKWEREEVCVREKEIEREREREKGDYV